MAQTRLRISKHAQDRWLQRVDPAASRTEARLAIEQFVSLGRSRPTPRWWLNSTPAPGTRFFFWNQKRGVCVLVARDGTAITVITQAESREHHRKLRLVPALERAKPRDVAKLRWRRGGRGGPLGDFTEELAA